MNGNVALDYRSPSAIRKLGIEVLMKELGVVGMAHFIRQFDKRQYYNSGRRISGAESGCCN